MEAVKLEARRRERTREKEIVSFFIGR